MSVLIKKYSTKAQYLVTVALVLIVSICCFVVRDYINYKLTGFILLFVVSLPAMLFDIRPVLLATVLSAGIWNFFFIPPIFTFHITSAEDNLLFASYFVVALVHSVLTYKIRAVEQLARDRTEKERIIQLYNTLLNSLSHELKTPIATIIGSADTLLEQFEKLSSEHKTELLEQIQIAGSRLNEQVENLLNISRIENGVLQPKPDWCDVNDLLYACVKDQQNNERIEIIVDDSLPLVFMDSGLLKQIIGNLVKNALQYASDAPVKINARMDEEILQFQVIDEGIGIKENDISKIFDKFYRGDAAVPGGIGLGLSIVKGFTDTLGGEVLIGSNTPSGAIFTVRFKPETSYIRNLKHE